MMEIRSYRRVFDLERRIYSVDRLRLNPGGVPVRGILYFLAILATMLIAASLPGVGDLVRVLPWLARDLALPAAGATVLSAIRVEGRCFHLAARGLVRYWAGPRRLAGTRRCRPPGEIWCPWDILMLPDGSDACMRSMRYTGPGTVLVSVEHERHGRAIEHGSLGTARPGRAPVLCLSDTRDGRVLREGKVISLEAGARLRVKSADRRD